MFQKWVTSDEIALAAAVLSALALVVSIWSARYGAIQAGVARRKETAEALAQQPVVEADVSPRVQSGFPGWRRVTIFVRNRIDEPIVCETLRVVKPIGCKIVAKRDVEISNDYVVTPGELPKNPTDTVRLDARVGAAVVGGPPQSFTPLAGLARYVSDQDRRHDDVLVLMPSTSSSSATVDLLMSLSVRRANESTPYAEIMIETKAAPLSTSTEP